MVGAEETVGRMGGVLHDTIGLLEHHVRKISRMEGRGAP